MTEKQLLALFDELGNFMTWMQDEPAQLGLLDALVTVRLAVWAEVRRQRLEVES